MLKLRLTDPRVQHLWQLFDVCDLDLDPVTLILKLDLDTVFTYLHAKNEARRSKGSKATAEKSNYLVHMTLIVTQ